MKKSNASDLPAAPVLPPLGVKLFWSQADVRQRVIAHWVGGRREVVPNLALSIKDVFDRFTRGQPIPDSIEGQWGVGHTEYDNLDRLQRAEMSKQNKIRIANLQAKLSDEQAQKAQAAALKEWNESVEAEVAKRTKPSPSKGELPAA